MDLTGLSALQVFLCYNNPCSNTTAGLDNIYCQLPTRTARLNGNIYVTNNTTVPAFVLATNGANANTKNRTIHGSSSSNTVITNTTGTYVCGTVQVSGVTLNPTTLALVSENTVVLTATVALANAANKKVTWASSNTSVATVNNGVVTALDPGTATITVTTAYGGYTATCEVRVTPIGVTGVTLNPTTLALVTENTAVLTATVAPANAANKKVTWTGSKPAIATVDNNGKVTALSVGTTTITVKTEDGGKTATCEVTVTATTVAVTGVTLDNTKLSIVVGKTANLVATVAPADATNKKVTWTSSKPAITTVDNNGKVTAKTVGTTTITVKTEDGNKTATCEVTVTSVKVNSIELAPKTLSLETGKTATLVANISPANAANKNVTWTSSKEAVATVDNNGKVTALAVGTTTITVKTEDGNKTATCEVMVTSVKVNSIELAPKTLSLETGKTATLVANISPANAANKNVTWTSSKEAIATVDNTGKVTALAIGTTTITVKTEDGNKTATCEVTVTEETNVDDVVENASSFTITPNPASEKLTLTMSANALAAKTLSIFNAAGKEILRLNSLASDLTIDVSNFTSGVYFINIDGVSRKFTIER